MKVRKLKKNRFGALLGGSLMAMLTSGCGMEGFGTSKMNFAVDAKVFACPAGNASDDCANVAHGSLLQPAGASGAIPTIDGGASGSLPTGGMNGASGSLPTGGMNGASGSLPSAGSGASGHLPTGGNVAGSSLPTLGSGANGGLPTGGSGANGGLPTGGSGANGGFPTGGSGANGGLPVGDNSPNSGPTYSMSGTTLTVNPTKVCGPNVLTESQSFLKKVNSGVMAALYRMDSAGSLSGSLVQTWNTPADEMALMNQLKQFTPFQLKLDQPLQAGTYSLVLYDSQREANAPAYSYLNGATAVAPMGDSVAHQLQPQANMKVAADGSISSFQPFNLLYSTQGDPECKNAGIIDPLVIRLSESHDELLMSSIANGVYFDILGANSGHAKLLTSWIQTPSYMFLVLPKSGQVNGIDEMFGNNSTGPDGRLASNGFEALAKFDSNHDGVIDAKDHVFSHLRLWSDMNRDGIAQPSEMFTLAEKGLVSLDLRYDPSFSETDQFGNSAQFKSAAHGSSGESYLLFDLWLTMRR